MPSRRKAITFDIKKIKNYPFEHKKVLIDFKRAVHVTPQLRLKMKRGCRVEGRTTGSTKPKQQKAGKGKKPLTMSPTHDTSKGEGGNRYGIRSRNKEKANYETRSE